MKRAFNLDDVYIGNVKLAKYFWKKRIRPIAIPGEKHNICSIGFCEKEQKWYGWSHRAMYGFGIGAEVKKGDCAYHASNIEDAIEDCNNFWRGEYTVSISTEVEGDEFVVKQLYNDKVPNKDLRNNKKQWNYHGALKTVEN